MERGPNAEAPAGSRDGRINVLPDSAGFCLRVTIVVARLPELRLLGAGFTFGGFDGRIGDAGRVALWLVDGGRTTEGCATRGALREAEIRGAGDLDRAVGRDGRGAIRGVTTGLADGRVARLLLGAGRDRTAGLLREADRARGALRTDERALGEAARLVIDVFPLDLAARGLAAAASGRAATIIRIDEMKARANNRPLRRSPRAFIAEPPN